MQIDFVRRRSAPDARARRHAEERLARVARFLVEPVAAQLRIDAERHLQIAELRVQHARGELHAREASPDLLDAISLAAESIEKQARKSRKRAVDRRRRAGRARAARGHWPVDVVDRASLADGRPKILRSSRLAIKPMTIEEAALQLQSSRNDFVVFFDSVSEKVSVLYKRRDEHYGLIAPEL